MTTHRSFASSTEVAGSVVKRIESSRAGVVTPSSLDARKSMGAYLSHTGASVPLRK